MTLPVLTAIRPPSIGDAPNGQVPLDLLVNVRMYEHYDVFLAPEMATAYDRLFADCSLATGVALGISGGGAYRTLQQQTALFLARYQTPPQPGRPTKTWQGKVWSLRVDPITGELLATAAVPGTSNHGLGAAVDLQEIDPASGAGTDISSSQAWPWLLENVVPHGLSWEIQKEPWHLRLVALPADPPPQEDEDMKTYFRVAGHTQDIYELGPPTVYISGTQGAILEAATPGWAADIPTLTLAADVDATLPRG